QGYTVEGFLVYIGAKEIVGSAGVLEAVLYDMDGTGTTTSGSNETAPGSVVESVSLDMDTEVDTADLTPVVFDNPVNRTSDYAVGLEFSNMDSDTLGVLASDSGNTGGTEYSWEQWDDQSWYTILAAWALDIDMFFLPVVDMGTDIDEQPFVNGVRMESYPNPAVDVVNIDYHIEEAAGVNLRIMDISGKTVKEKALGHQQAGEHHTAVSTEGMDAGVYFYMLEAGNNRLAKKIIIQ
ncbi:MAG: T9SS type A sorting domain-containing protein, partial [Bacteroidales bacterium]